MAASTSAARVDHRLHCVDAKTGEPMWDFYTDGPIRLAPTLAHGNVYFGSDDGWFIVSRDRRHVVWKMRVGPEDDRLLSRGEMISRWPVRTGVLIDGDMAYFGAGVFPHETVYLCAVNARKTVRSFGATIRSANKTRAATIFHRKAICSPMTSTCTFRRADPCPWHFQKQTGEIVFQRTHSWRTDAGGVVGGTKALLGRRTSLRRAVPITFWRWTRKPVTSASRGSTVVKWSWPVSFAYLMDGEKIFCVNRAEHAKASQEKQKWFLKAREFGDDPKNPPKPKQKMQEYMKVGIIWEYAE